MKECYQSCWESAPYPTMVLHYWGHSDPCTIQIGCVLQNNKSNSLNTSSCFTSKGSYAIKHKLLLLSNLYNIQVTAENRNQTRCQILVSMNKSFNSCFDGSCMVLTPDPSALKTQLLDDWHHNWWYGSKQSFCSTENSMFHFFIFLIHFSSISFSKTNSWLLSWPRDTTLQNPMTLHSATAKNTHRIPHASQLQSG